MTAREFFRTIRKERAEIKALREKREAIASSLLPKAMGIKEIQVMESAEQDPVGKRMAIVVDIDTKISERMVALYAKQDRAIELINMLTRTEQRLAMWTYYIKTDWPVGIDEVAEMIGYSTDRCKHLMSDAYKAIDNMPWVSFDEWSKK